MKDIRLLVIETHDVATDAVAQLRHGTCPQCPRGAVDMARGAPA